MSSRWLIFLYAPSPFSAASRGGLAGRFSLNYTAAAALATGCDYIRVTALKNKWKRPVRGAPFVFIQARLNRRIAWRLPAAVLHGFP